LGPKKRLFRVGGKFCSLQGWSLSSMTMSRRIYWPNTHVAAAVPSHLLVRLAALLMVKWPEMVLQR